MTRVEYIDNDILKLNHRIHAINILFLPCQTIGIPTVRHWGGMWGSHGFGNSRRTLGRVGGWVGCVASKDLSAVELGHAGNLPTQCVPSRADAYR